MLLSIKIEFRAKSLEFIHRCADISESLAPSAHLCINSKLLTLRLQLDANAIQPILSLLFDNL